MGKSNIYKLIKNPSPDLIEALSDDKCPISNPSYEFIHSKIRTKGIDYCYKNFIKIIAAQKSEILSDVDYMKAIHLMYTLKDWWIRDINTWVKKSRSRDKQFREIINHLFVKYEVPEFMYNVWKSNNLTQIDWFINMANGKNIRTCKSLPFELTKRVAHLFKSAPDDFLPLESIRYAQIIDLGGDMRTVKGIMSSKLSENFKEKHFWDSVIKFFINNPMLDTAQYNPIVDYIQYVKFQRTTLVNGIWSSEKPNFSMKDRNVDALLILVEKWHKQTQKVDKKGVHSTWAPVPINNFDYSTGKDENNTIYTITQILKTCDLKTEGRVLKHCVGSYSSSCVSGRCSIWSLSKSSNINSLSKMVTIELSKDKTISQIRGKLNRLPNNEEFKIINMWADKEYLKISKWIK